MSKNESFELNEQSPSSILNAPKLKFKKATLSPTPFSLNDSNLEEENIVDSFDEQSLDEEGSKEFKNLNDSKSKITSLFIKFKSSLKQ